MALETTSTLSNVCKAVYDRLLLETLVGQFWHLKFGDVGRNVTLEKDGQMFYSIEWRRWGALPTVTTPLTQGTPPAGNNHSVTVVTATPAEYGDYIKHTGVLQMTSIDPYIKTTVGKQAIQAAQTCDEIGKDVLNAGTNVQYAGGVASRVLITSSNKISTDEIDLAVKTLELAFVPLFPDEWGGSYIAFIHPKAKVDLRKDSRWQAADNYAGSVKAYSGELGRWNNVRLINNAYAKKFVGAGASGIDVYSTLVFGMHFYGIPQWAQDDGGETMPTDAGIDVQVYVKPVGSAGTADPVNQVGSVGWKVNFVVKILNDACCVRIEHA